MSPDANIVWLDGQATIGAVVVVIKRKAKGVCTASFRTLPSTTVATFTISTDDVRVARQCAAAFALQYTASTHLSTEEVAWNVIEPLEKRFGEKSVAMVGAVTIRAHSPMDENVRWTFKFEVEGARLPGEFMPPLGTDDVTAKELAIALARGLHR